MKIIQTKDYDEMSDKACNLLLNQLSKKSNSVIGFATGKTPLGLYKRLIEEDADFSKVRAFNLDEYYPIKKESKKSFYYYMFDNLFNYVNIKKSNINLLNGETKNPEKECNRYEKKIKKNRIDLLILGLGINGHIAYNEPGSSFKSRTRLVELTNETTKNKRVPKKALTIGIDTIMSAKKVVLLACGKKKAKAVKCLVTGKISERCPASVLRKHKNFTLIIDKAAWSLS